MPQSSEAREAERPLLLNDGANGDPEMGQDKAKENTWGSDLRHILLLAAPAILQLSFQQAVIVVNQAMAGHLGPEELAAAAISATYFNLMWFFIIGSSSALDTLASQAYGAGDRKGVLQWAISAAAVLSILAVPMGVGLYFADSVASVIFQQPPEISALVGIYCRWILPGLWPFIWSLIIMKTMQAQNMMWGPLFVTIAMFVANIFIQMGLIRLFGFAGAALGGSVSRIALFVFLLIYVSSFGRGCIQLEMPACYSEETGHSLPGQRAPLEEAERPGSQHHIEPSGVSGKTLGSRSPWEEVEGDAQEGPGLTKFVAEGLSGYRLSTFLRLGVAGGLMMAADASSFDITTVMAGLIGVEEVGAHVCLLTMMEFLYVAFPYGIATTATIRVGNMLGAGNATSARQSAYLCLALCGCFNAVITVLFFIFGRYVGHIFTNDPTVIYLVAKLAVLGGIFQIPDCIFGSVSGILRGTGRQSSLMWINLAGFWGVGIPTCYLLAFKFGLGLEGLWIGLVAGLSSSALLVLSMLLMLDWKKEAARANSLAMQSVDQEAAEEADGPSSPLLSQRDTGETGPVAGEILRMAFSQPSTLATRRTAQSGLPRYATQPHLIAAKLQLPSTSKSLRAQRSIETLTGSYARAINPHL